MLSNYQNATKLLAIGTRESSGKHARSSSDHVGKKVDTGFSIWIFGMFMAAVPLFVVPVFRFITGDCDVRAMFAMALGSTATLYVGITMAVTSMNDVGRAGISPSARVYHEVCIILLVIGLLVYAMIALAPEFGRSVDAGLQLCVNVVYVLVELAVGCLGYALIRRG